ncbi:MAG: hypothetical protein IT317_22020 [Anaerolineales bacterium]|nr:hypothetical protein [Anaerolineales bacterium]
MPPPTPDPDDTRPAPRPSHIGGDYVGGNKTVTQSAGGDIVGRDKITTTTGGDPLAAATLAEAFARIEALVAARAADPAVEKDEITETLGRIAVESEKGEAANPPKLERLLTTLGGMADDIFQVTAACLANPALGVATTIRLIAEKAKAEHAKRAAGGG